MRLAVTLLLALWFGLPIQVGGAQQPASYSGTYADSLSDATVNGSNFQSGAEGDDQSSLSLSYSANLVSGAWVSTGHGMTSTTGHYNSDYDGGGSVTVGVTVTGPTAGTVSGPETETGIETSSYSSSATESLGSDGNWTFTAGVAGHSMDSLYNSSSYAGSGTYGHTINGGTATGSDSYIVSGTNTSSIDGTLAVNSAGAWSSSATQTNVLNNSYSLSYNGSGAYSRQVETTPQQALIGGTTDFGTYTEDGTGSLTSSYASSTSIHPDGSTTVTGGTGTSTLSSEQYSSYSGSGGTPGNPSTSSTYTEKGADDVSANVTSAYAADPAGTWWATSVDAFTHGNDNGGYTYSYHDSQGDAGKVSEAHHYDFNGDLKTLAPTEGGTPTYSGSITADGSPASGTISCTTPTISGGWSTQSESYSYLPSWTESMSWDAGAGKGTLTGPAYTDPGTDTYTDASGTAHPSSTSNGSPGFATIGNVVRSLPFDPGQYFGYQGTPPAAVPLTAVPPPSLQTQWYTMLSHQGATVQGLAAFAGEAPPSVQTAFNHSLVDRGIGSVDGIDRVVSSGLIPPIPIAAFDPANRQQASNVSSTITVGVMVFGSAGGAIKNVAGLLTESAEGTGAMLNAGRGATTEITTVAAEDGAVVGETGAAAESTPDALYSFGNKSGPRGARPVTDFGVADERSIVGPESPPSPAGASSFGDPTKSGLTGHYHSLPAGTPLPPEIGVVPDGMDVLPGSTLAATHHTFYPRVSMTVDQFNELFKGLPWSYAGKL